MDWRTARSAWRWILKFVKAYIRKAKIQHFLKQFHKALVTFDQALELEPGNDEVREGKRATMIAIQSSESDPERAKEAMKDPRDSADSQRSHHIEGAR